jgi:hypothetical protein
LLDEGNNSSSSGHLLLRNALARDICNFIRSSAAEKAIPDFMLVSNVQEVIAVHPTKDGQPNDKSKLPTPP